MLYLTNRIMPLIVLGIITTATTAQAEDMTINRLLASQCAQCHGTNGHPVKDIDSLAGEDDISSELREMSNKNNPDDIMEHQAMGYTSDQIQRIAAYYASLSENGGSNPGDSGGSDSGGSDSGGSDSGGSDSGGSDSGGSDSGDSDEHEHEHEHEEPEKKKDSKKKRESRRKERSERKRSRDHD